ncbi:hypothetical protein PJE062_5020 [Pseudovibrio sp. JE062]|nr:hypothetical protein PJE062_5020 [Pseudovibrio sp. JE062]
MKITLMVAVVHAVLRMFQKMKMVRLAQGLPESKELAH